MFKIGYLGPEGTFSEKATSLWMSMQQESAFSTINMDSIPQLFHELEDGALEQIVVPIENSIEGAVNITQDYLITADEIVILGEICLQIEHYLVAKTEKRLEDVSAIYSHPQALSQCHLYLQKNLSHAKLHQTGSTAEAAQIAWEKGSGVAAISSWEAAIKYGLNILGEKIHDFDGNKTRFLVLSKGKTDLKPKLTKQNIQKTSLLVALPHNRPGGLYGILKEFAEAGINLARIESRPTKIELGEYLFIIDFIGCWDDEQAKDVLGKLREKAAMLKILGSYPVFEY